MKTEWHSIVLFTCKNIFDADNFNSLSKKEQKAIWNLMEVKFITLLLQWVFNLMFSGS